jgi:glucan phosphoethanolaminetransferase (alkaline phosphatase superfamily)
VLFSLLLILILVVIICIPPLFTSIDVNQQINTYLLIFLIFVFVALGIAIVVFINYQHRQAIKQRMNSTYGVYTLQKARLRRGESMNTNDTELQVPKFSHSRRDEERKKSKEVKKK